MAAGDLRRALHSIVGEATLFPTEPFISEVDSPALDPEATPSRAEVTMLTTRFEKARIVGARALQVSMGAPPLIEVDEDIRDPVQVSMLEYEADAIPLTVQRLKVQK